MTVLTSIMRDAGRHSKLVDITTIRLLLSVDSLIPLPPDALVTPVTFRVRKRQLRGILAQYDALEDGSRELSGEWVVSKKLWKRLQAEWRASQKSPTPPRKHHKERVVLYLHGGAYYLFSPATHRRITIPLSKFTDARVFAVDYRLAPETRFPGPLHDAVSTYFRLLEDLHIPPENILFAGDSAGGGLCLALLMYLRDNEYPLPAGAILMSPWVDLTQSCDSWDSNAPFDIVPIPISGDHLDPVGCYLGPHMERYLTHPYASPLFGNFKGLPPMLIQAGEAEVLRDEITLLAHKATLAGVEVMHELYEDGIHVFQALSFFGGTHNAFLSCRAFVRMVLPLMQAHSPRVLGGEAEAELEHEIDNERARMVRGDGVEASRSSVASAETTAESDEGSGELVTDSADDSFDECSDDDDDDALHVRRRPFPSAYASDPESSSSSRSPSPRRRRYVSAGAAARHLRLSALSIGSTPAPAIRSSASHPDISSLCAQWERSGPANRTITYRPNGGAGR
ncbi:hypothetical protein BV25DRAFT_1820557 [Artomyces pyxidatus]|uniref:Uncharacterized protein n=1 Tax=Artomyces pyxidatus TaxID=48021 RepID=A0ACB8TDR4_9AGAM|nr:hypothetical protein BV25DRAFT_1820557 [Artomyces pyxidatus]